MPRQIDLFPQNLQVTNDPNNQISVTAAQINSLNDQIPAAIAKAEELFLNNVLDAIDKATGLDLVAWLADAQAFFNSISASLQQSWLNLQNFFNGLAQTADADVTLALQWLQGQFNQLQALLQQSWLNFQNLLNGIVQEADADVTQAIAWLQGVGVAANNALTQIEDFLVTGDWSDLSTAWNDLVQGIFGSSTSLGLVGSIPAPAVVNTPQNLQPVWDFPDSASLSGAGSQWSWDGSEDHTGVAGSGSAKFVCGGTPGALRGIPGAVQPSQTVTPSAWVMWSGLTAAGGTSPIQLELIPYSGAGSTLFAGTPVTIASVTSPASSHAWEELTGTYTVPSSGVTAVQLRLVVTADATAGNIWWDDCQCDLSGGFLADMQADTNDIINSFAPGGTVGEFQTGVTNLLALFGLTPSSVGGATVIDSIWTAVVNDFINPLNAIETQATNIIGDIEQSAVSGLTDVWDWLTGTPTPPTSSSVTQVQAGAVPAVGNQANLLDAVQAGWDALVQAFTGTTDTGHSLGGLANAASTTSTTAGNALTTAQSATMVQAQQATAKPGYMAIDSTMDAVFPLSHMIAAPTYNNVTQAGSTIGFICIPDNVSKLSVAWLGSYTGTISALYINVYSMNTTTGVLTNMVAGANYIGSVGNALSWNYYDLPTAVPAAVGDVYGVEMVVVGTGIYSLMGLANSTFPQNSNVYPKALGAGRGLIPSHDAAGGGSFTTTSTTSFSWSHVLGSSATGIIIAFSVSSSSVTVSSVKVGGVTATAVASKAWNASAATAYVYQLLSPPTGTQTVTVTLSGAATFAGNSDSYNGVTSFGTAANNSGTSSPASLSVSSASGQTAVAAVFAINSVSAFNQTSRWTGGTSSVGYFGVFGDAAGTSTVSFSATTGGQWAAIGVSLVGASATAPGTIASPTYATTVPWFGMGTSAIVVSPVFAPETASYATHGTYTFTLPTWFKSGVDFLDAILLGPGGGGGGGIGDAGASGGTTSVTVGGTTVTAASGSGALQGNTNAAGAVGASPGNETYNGTTYYGGSASSYSYGLVTVGSSPGGGGAGGGTSGTYGFGGHSGAWTTHTFNPTGTTVSVTVGTGGLGSPFFGAENGADGAVWLVARQA